jgi:chitin disaccharide deacetylase
MTRRLVVNADDFGLTPGVDEGILAAFHNGIVRSTSIMANGAAFEHAVNLAQRHPGLDVGCHLVLTGGESVSRPGTALPKSLAALLCACAKNESLAEMAAQVEKVLGRGIRPTHLDTHRSVHLFPPVMKDVARTAADYGIRWVRLPFDFGWQDRAIRLREQAPRLLRPSLKRILAAGGCRTTDNFTGLYMMARFSADSLESLFRMLPSGTTEFMCHPGFCTDELRSAPTHLQESRQRELEALTCPRVLTAIEREQIELVSYRDLDYYELGQEARHEN